jgi:hypothetical protein
VKQRIETIGNATQVTAIYALCSRQCANSHNKGGRRA